MHAVAGRRVEDFDLHKELYRGKTSLLYMATDKKSGMQVALKLYRKRKLSTLNKSVSMA
jgi:aurora kinase